MTLAAYLQSRLTPTIEVIIHTDGTHTRESGEALLLCVIVAAIAEVTVGTDDERMLPLGRGSVNRPADIETGEGLKIEILDGIAVKFPHLREHRLCVDPLCKIVVDSQELTHLTLHRVAALFPRILVGIERIEPSNHLASVGLRAARILVAFQFICILVLLHEFEVEGHQDIRERLLDRIGADARIGVRKHESCGVDVIFQTHLKTLPNFSQHLAERTAELVFKSILSKPGERHERSPEDYAC